MKQQEITMESGKRLPGGLTGQRWQLILGLLVSIIFVWIAGRDLDLSQVWLSLRQANYRWALLVFLSYFVTVGMRAWRWQFLLRPLKHLSTRHLMAALMVGYLGNNIYPFRVGELLRVAALRWRAGVSLSTGLATMLVERVFDGLGILTIVFAALLVTPLPHGRVRALITVTAALFFGLLLIFLALASLPDQAYRLAAAGSGRFLPGAWADKVMGIVDHFLVGLAALRNGRAVLAVYGFSVLIWLVETAKYWLMMLAFPFTISFIALMLTNGVVNLATILPSAPGFIGTFDLPAITLLQFFGVNEGVATAYTVALHAALWLPSTLFGLLYLLGMGLSWADLGRLFEISRET